VQKPTEKNRQNNENRLIEVFTSQKKSVGAVNRGLWSAKNRGTDNPAFELQGARGWGIEPLIVFSTTHCQIMYREVSYILYTYYLHHIFVRSPTAEKFNSPANFSQSKHYELNPKTETQKEENKKDYRPRESTWAP